MSINSPEELAGMRAAGVVVCRVLDAMKRGVHPHITTADLDEIGARVMRANGGQSAPALVYRFPGVNCISVNEEAVHGIPGKRKLREGDLVKLDVTVEKDGFMADGAITVPVGAVSEEKQRLIAVPSERLRWQCRSPVPAPVSLRLGVRSRARCDGAASRCFASSADMGLAGRSMKTRAFRITLILRPTRSS